MNFVKKLVCFDSFGAEHILKEIKEFIEEFAGNKNIKAKIFRIQENSTRCGYFWVYKFVFSRWFFKKW